MNDLELDLTRGTRTGVADVVSGEGRASDNVVAAVGALFDRDGFALAIHIESKTATALLKRFADSRYDARARAFAAGKRQRSGRSCGVVHATSADLACAEEAAFCLEALGHDVVRLGNMRLGDPAALVERTSAIERCDVVIVVAGSDAGAAAAIAGLVRAPVIGVPTSPGGLAAMLAVQTSGIAVVDVGAGCAAAIVAHKIAPPAAPASRRRPADAARSAQP
jgi:NCAIR mutase (PurE)-related protein